MESNRMKYIFATNGEYAGPFPTREAAQEWAIDNGLDGVVRELLSAEAMEDHIREVVDGMMARPEEFREFLEEWKTDINQRERDQTDEEK
jgi:hypothetical protein